MPDETMREPNPASSSNEEDIDDMQPSGSAAAAADLGTPTAGTPPSPPTPSPTRSRRKGPKLNEKERQVRAEMVLARKLTGNKLSEIAEEFHISRATTYRALSQARRDGLYEQAKDFIQSRLLPKALAVYDQALDNMDVEVARDVIQGLGLTGRNLQVAVKHEVKEDFDSWRLAKAKAIEGQIVAQNATNPPDDQADPQSSGADVSGEGPDGFWADAVPTQPSVVSAPDGEQGVFDWGLRTLDDPDSEPCCEASAPVAGV